MENPQIERLARFVRNEMPLEALTSEGEGDRAIRIIRSLRAEVAMLRGLLRRYDVEGADALAD